MPLLLIVAGPNGSGKTTLVRSGALSDFLAVPSNSINADDVAREMAGGGHPSPIQSLRAAQICDARLDDEIAANRSVMVETVLSSDKLKHRVTAAKARGFRVALVYVTVRDGRINLTRVDQRRAEGGHDVPADRVLARRERSHALFSWFAREADFVLVFDNTLYPVHAAGKSGAGWVLTAIDRLPADLADNIRALAEPSPSP